MARQPYFVNSNQKQMEVYGSFGGGMVTQAHPERLNDDQSVILDNVDIVAGGVVQNRGAYSQTNAPSTVINGKTQGRWRYRNTVGSYTDIIAINGALYTVVNNTYTLLPITGLASFQTTRLIEAIQYRDTMYFATGSGLVKYTGTTASLVTAHVPNGLEALYIGKNGYAANPDGYLADVTGAANLILGVTFSARYGITNENVTFTAFVEKVAVDTLEYQFETKRVDEVTFVVAKAWSTSKVLTTKFATKGDYMVRVSLRKQGTTPVLSQYVIPKYKVQTTPDEKPEPTINFDDLKLCNRIFFHYDRLWLYGDTGNPDHLYSSHLNKFDYFPRTNIIRVSDPLRGSLQNVTPYRNFLVCFTNNSIQTITGKSPQEFEKQPIHTSLGTKFPNSVQVTLNYITFVGSDYGVYVLKSFNYASTDDKMNVQRIDDNIKDVLTSHLKSAARALTCVYDNQYYLYLGIGTTDYVWKFYHELGIWVRDTLSLNFGTMDVIDNVVHVSDLNGGIIYQLKSDVFRDGVNTVYNMRINSKDYDFNMPHHRKKLKQYQILAKITSATTISVSLYTDNTLLSTTPLVSDVTQVTDAQKLKIMASGRFRYVKTSITIPVHELIQLIGFGFVFKQNTPK